jgi:hypothetical protein
MKDSKFTRIYIRGKNLDHKRNSKGARRRHSFIKTELNKDTSDLVHYFCRKLTSFLPKTVQSYLWKNSQI